MDSLNSQPKSPDAQDSVDASGAGGTEAGKESEAAKVAVELDRLSEALGRKISDPEEALKAVKNLHSLVGDRSIANLRKKAETHDTFEALVTGYAKEEGIGQEEARKYLSDLARDSAPRKDDRVDAVLKEMSELKVQLQEKDFISEHPEAKSVLKELKALAAQTGQTIAEAYESSSLKGIVTKAVASDEREKTGTSLRPSNRSGMPSDRVNKALENLKSDRSGEAKDRAVKAALGL